MKKRALTAVAVLLVSLQVKAGFQLDKKVYRMDQLEEAKTKAVEEGKPLTFIYTDEKTTCGLCAGSSTYTISELVSKSIIVYVHNNDRQKLPEVVSKAYTSPEMGKYIPKTVVVKPELDSVIAMIPYARGSEQDKLLKNAKKKIAESMPKKGNSLKPLKPTETTAMTTTEPAEEGEVRTWTAKGGTQIKASLVKESGAYLMLKKEDGKEVRVFLSKLSKEDQDYVASLKQASE